MFSFEEKGQDMINKLVKEIMNQETGGNIRTIEKSIKNLQEQHFSLSQRSNQGEARSPLEALAYQIGELAGGYLSIITAPMFSS